jgi:hypothetical protein
MGYLTGKTTTPPSEITQIGADGKEVKNNAAKVIMVPNPEYEDCDALDQQVLS